MRVWLTGFWFSLCIVSISLFNCRKPWSNSPLIGFRWSTLHKDAVRASMLIRINSSWKVIHNSSVNRWKMLELLNKGVLPYIPERTLSRSFWGFAPLSHMVYQCWALGRAYYKGELLSGRSLRSCWEWKIQWLPERACLDQWYAV